MGGQEGWEGGKGGTEGREGGKEGGRGKREGGKEGGRVGGGREGERKDRGEGGREGGRGKRKEGGREGRREEEWKRREGGTEGGEGGRGREMRTMTLYVRLLRAIRVRPLSSLPPCLSGGPLEDGKTWWDIGLGLISDHASLDFPRVGGGGPLVRTLPGAGVEENWGRDVVVERVDWLHRSGVCRGDNRSIE